MEYIGMDLHQKYSEICELNEAGEITETARIPTTATALTRWFGGRTRTRICVEASGISPWVDRLLRELGHEVIVCNPHRVRLIAESTLKNDRIDAEILARLVRLDPTLLRPITHRGEQTRLVRGTLRARATLVRARTACVNTIRGLLRAFGYKLTKGTDRFAERVQTAQLPDDLRAMVAPLTQTVAHLEQQILTLDAQVETQGRHYPEVAQFRQVPGVGPLVSLAFVLCLEDPHRFRRSRDVAAFLGLRPTLRESAGQTRRGHITKQGEPEMRRLLIQAAYGVQRSRQESQLKQGFARLAERIGRKKATVALARKLAVLMHRLWVTGQPYQAFPANGAEATTPSAAA
jgi:transposase